MAHFSPEFLSFFKELAANNNKDWFDANRKRYEEWVKKPMEQFVADVIARIKQYQPEITIAPKEAIFRINRDIRFSADKTPYKTNTSALITPGGRKDMLGKGLYVELGPEHLGIYGGFYQLDTSTLLQVRTWMASNLKELHSALAEPNFEARFGTLHGEKQQRLPKELKDAGEKWPALYQKQFYFYKHLPAKEITSNNLVEQIMEYYVASLPVQEVLQKSLGT